MSPEVDPVNNQVRVWAELENPDLRLKPGMSGTMVIMAEDETGPKDESGEKATADTSDLTE